MIKEKRGSIDYDETGAGPTIVLVPGSCSTAAAWRPVVAHLKDDFRCVTTSLLGYGGTAERRTALDADISREVEILESVIHRAARPVHLVGHSFGGLCALAVAVAKRAPLLSLTLLEAPAAEILRQMGEIAHYRAFREMTNGYFAAYRAGEPTAIERMIDFYGGAGTFAAWPQRVRDYAVETTPVNILDWAGAYGLPLTPALLATIEIPTQVVWGAASHPAARRANDLLGHCIPGASMTSIGGANHFMISTHAAEVAELIGQDIARVDGSGDTMISRVFAANRSMWS